MKEETGGVKKRWTGGGVTMERMKEVKGSEWGDERQGGKEKRRGKGEKQR